MHGTVVVFLSIASTKYFFILSTIPSFCLLQIYNVLGSTKNLLLFIARRQLNWYQIRYSIEYIYFLNLMQKKVIRLFK